MTDYEVSPQRLYEVSAKQEIRDNLLIYCRGVDRCVPELIKAAFWPDAFDNHGAMALPAHEFADAITASKLESTEWNVHTVTNHLVELENPDLAFSEATVVTYQKALDSTDVQVFCGRYVDRVERRDGVWKIAYRNLVRDWSGSLEVGGWGLASVAADAFIPGARQGADFVTGQGRQDLMSASRR